MNETELLAGSGPHPGWRLALAGGLSAVVAAAAVVPAVSHPGGAGNTITVRELAYRAAAAERQPQVRLKQWVY